MATIYRYAHPVAFSLAFYFSVCFALGECVAADREFASGTYVAIGIGDGLILVGADSRVTIGGQIRDDACKIRILSGKAVFTHMGLGIVEVDGPSGRSVYDPAVTAVTAVTAFRAMNGDISRSGVEWSNQISTVASTMPDGLEAIGVFAGLEPDGRSHVRRDRLTNKERFAPEEQFSTTPGMSFILPDREKALSLDIINSGQFKAINANQSVTQIIRYGQLIKFLITEVIEHTKATGRNDIGGDVAVLALQRGAGPSWQYPTEPCSRANR